MQSQDEIDISKFTDVCEHFENITNKFQTFFFFNDDTGFAEV